MRVLTVRQPWAAAIIYSGKDVENRVRNVAGTYRGPVAIHAGLARDASAIFPADVPLPVDVYGTDGGLVRSAIIGVVDLTDVHSASVIHGCGWLRHDCPEHGTCREHCSKWAMGPTQDGWFQHLVLANPRPLAEPIPFKGALGLRTLDDDTTARVLAALTPTETNRTPS